MRNKSDVYLNLVKGLKFWDTCAGDALIKARFGEFRDSEGRQINYDHEFEDSTI